METVKGDIPRYMVGDPSAGMFQTGFYLIMLFGLPTMALAIYNSNNEAEKKATKKMLILAVSTSVFLGITEPIELLIFIKPFRLYFGHALLKVVSLALCEWLSVAHGFSFLAGIVDYILMWELSTNTLWILPLGVLFALAYYHLTFWGLKALKVKLFSAL